VKGYLFTIARKAADSFDALAFPPLLAISAISA
jgi:hypothetical protein